MALTIALHKPYGFLSRFTADGSKWQPLSSLGLPADVYAVGRLDADSEGLLLLSNDPRVQRLGHAEAHIEKCYWVQVERVPDSKAIAQLCAGMELDGLMTRPARASLLDVVLPPREPPIRFRKNVPEAWLEIVITEGRNRQVRRMTAAVGHPTLRLIRRRIGAIHLGDLVAGAHRVVEDTEITDRERTTS
jgi:23S rRNA pseudouridine2457 synthase